MAFSPLLEHLIHALQMLPGIGPKSAQRIAFSLLEGNRRAAKQLVSALGEALEHIGRCSRCQTLSETEICQICSDSRRDSQLLAIVESPADVMAFEAGTGFQGLYFVLMGHLSPIDGIGPEELGLPLLAQRLQEDAELHEIIIATNPTVEGEATAHYISELVKADAPKLIKVSRLAHGIPVGGELEYIDGSTLAYALRGRVEV